MAGLILEIIIAILLIGFIISAIDDVILDLIYWVIRPFRRRSNDRISRAALNAVPQRRAAIFVPAWQEQNVIRNMLSYNARIIDYDNYDFIVGTYPNDPETREEVRRLRSRYANVFEAVTPHAGPTNKGDNLNSMYARLREREREIGEKYDFVVLHDPEDVLHPQELKLFNYEMANTDAAMVQTPIFPIAEPIRLVTASTYMDEFAEVHTKDLHVRQWVAGFVPSAGVGTAIRREILNELAGGNGGNPFKIDSLTEDYELGLRIAQAGHRAVFASCRLEDPPENVPERIATRAHFPSTLKQAVRQRSRWTLGIAFQSWKNRGWTGSAATRWLLFRDRKSIATNFLIAGAYAVVVWVLTYLLLRALFFPGWPSPIPDNRWIRLGFLITLIFMLHRLLQRAIATARVYGLLQGLLAIPRQVWSNIINVWATARAARQFTVAEWAGVEVAWDKTKQRVPLLVRSRGNQRRLGEILRDRGDIDSHQLEQALELQRSSGHSLGAELIALSYITTDQLVRALREQEGDLELPTSTQG